MYIYICMHIKAHLYVRIFIHICIHPGNPRSSQIRLCLKHNFGDPPLTWNWNSVSYATVSGMVVGILECVRVHLYIHLCVYTERERERERESEREIDR